MQPTTTPQSWYQEENQQQPTKIRTIHMWYEETDADEAPVIEAEDDPEPETPIRSNVLTIGYSFCLALTLIGIYVLGFWLPQVYPNTYDSTLTRMITLRLSERPMPGQVGLLTLPAIRKTAQITVRATGSFQQKAEQASGVLTIYNGSSLTEQLPQNFIVSSSTGIEIATDQAVVIPGASPPQFGVATVWARALTAGSAGNIAAGAVNVQDGSSLTIRNLSAFRGGQDGREIPRLTQVDLSKGKQEVSDMANTAVNSQAQAEMKPGEILLPLDCSHTLTATHQAGDLAASAVLTLTESCTPHVYFAPDLASVAQRAITIPAGSHLVSFSAFVLTSHLSATGGTLTVEAIAYLKQNMRAVHPYPVMGK